MIKLISNVVTLAVVATGAAVYLEGKFEKQKDNAQKAQPVAIEQSYPKPLPVQSKPLIGRMARIKMDDRGHFVTKAKMNGSTIEVLVDTGATSVALDEKTARKMGIRLKQSDFKYDVNTANGVAKAASAQIDKIQIGRVTINNVQAAVLQGKGLNGTLLGMSFLKQLREFQIKDGELIMRQ